MRSALIVFISFLACACSTNSKQEIVVPKLHAGFYAGALDQINEKLKSDPTNTNLVEQKIYYCDQLNWPTNCLSALDTYKAKYGMSNQLVEQYIQYYEQHGRYQLLLELIDRWSEEYELEEKFHKSLIKSLVETQNASRAKYELRRFLVSEELTVNDLQFASKQYLSLNDTLMVIYQLSRLEKLDPINELMFDYGKILVSKGYKESGYNVLERYHASLSDDFDRSYEIYQLYDQDGIYDKARTKIKPYSSRDDIAFTLSDSYKKEFLWDSAVLYVDSVINMDSLNMEAWWRKGNIYEERGWLSFSLRFYEKMLQIDSVDTSATKRIELIQRKIAYLQRQKFEESKVPILELESIKIKN